MSVNLERRVAALEKKVARLQKRQTANGSSGREWLNDLYGKFADDPIFEQAMKLGRNYRRSLRARARRAKPKR